MANILYPYNPYTSLRNLGHLIGRGVIVVKLLKITNRNDRSWDNETDLSITSQVNALANTYLLVIGV